MFSGVSCRYAVGPFEPSALPAGFHEVPFPLPARAPSVPVDNAFGHGQSNPGAWEGQLTVHSLERGKQLVRGTDEGLPHRAKPTPAPSVA